LETELGRFLAQELELLVSIPLVVGLVVFPPPIMFKNQVLSRAFSFIFVIREASVVGWRIIGLSSDELVSNSPGLYPSHDETFW
jgi:hypothetical protein